MLQDHRFPAQLLTMMARAPWNRVAAGAAYSKADSTVTRYLRRNLVRTQRIFPSPTVGTMLQVCSIATSTRYNNDANANYSHYLLFAAVALAASMSIDLRGDDKHRHKAQCCGIAGVVSSSDHNFDAR